MSANKARVQVRGTVGKSIRFPTIPSGTGATLGVDFKLPDGSVPSLQQLAAALMTGAALQDQPGNIIPPGGGGGGAVLWQNIQYVPANVLYPARAVPLDEDAGEEYYRMAVPGPVGLRGPQGFSGAFADDPEDPISIPGMAGVAGVAGVMGALSTIHLYPDDAEDPGLIPGAAGPVGQAGSQGAPGIISAVHLWPDDAEDPISIPGAAGSPGQTGAAGAPGVFSSVHMFPDDAEDPGLIPGSPGAAGAAGAAGPPGIISAVHLWPDDPEDPLHFMGAQGNVGATGPAGASAIGAGWAAYLDADSYEDQLQAIRAVPNNPRFQSLVIDGVAGKPLQVNGLDNNAVIQINSPAGATQGMFLSWQNSGVEYGFIGNGPATNAGLVLADFAFGSDTGALAFLAAGTLRLKIGATGQYTYGGLSSLTATTTAGGVALPALAAGFLDWIQGGVHIKIPYYAN